MERSLADRAVPAAGHDVNAHTPAQGASRRLRFGDGSVDLAADGQVLGVSGPNGRPFLLREAATAPEASWHGADHRWGSGFLISDRGSARWHSVDRVDVRDDGVDLTYRVGDLRLDVTRTIGSAWRETYRWTNEGEPTRISSLAISTPWRDLYTSAADSLASAVHAHVWTGGSDAWVWAQPMDGSAPGLGLDVITGALYAYSIESRNPDTGSNVRGHVYLHVTDRARNPDAMGGQPEISLETGQSYELSWQLAWYGRLDDLHATRSPLAEVDEFAVERGRPIVLRTAPGARPEVDPQTLDRPGVHEVWVRQGPKRCRVSVLVHPPLRTLVEARIRFLLDRQRPVEREGSRAYAFVPLDLDSGLRVQPGAWADWNDGRERVGSALLLQQARRSGWGEAAELDGAIRDYRSFVLEHLVGEDGTVADGSSGPSRVRLYNFPWFTRFLLDTGTPEDLDRAWLIMQRYYALGGDHFLAFGVGSVLTEVSDRLDAAGRTQEAIRARQLLIMHASRFVALGSDLPAHEVNYEQSMVAPLLDLLICAHRVDPEAVGSDALRARLPWLTAFAADQPDVRLRHIPIRHWDGYWFGRDRLWGDVFPHYWSILSAGVFLDWPETAADSGQLADLRRSGHAILRANLVNFAADGTATCAFVYPSAVDGRAAHRADPLINDQDWALVYALRYGI